MRRLGFLSGIAVVASLWPNLVHAQTTVYIPDVAELSGAGAVSGTNWRDGVALAVDEINASGGILGRKIETEHLDTQSNPGISRAQVWQWINAGVVLDTGDMIYGYGRAAIPSSWSTAAPATIAAVTSSDLVEHYTQYAYWRGMVANLF